MNEWQRWLDFINKSGLLPFLGGVLASAVGWLNSRGKRRSESDVNAVKILNAALEERDKNYNSVKHDYEDLKREFEHYKEEHPQ